MTGSPAGSLTIESLRDYVGWTDDDTRALAGLRTAVSDRMSGILEAFYVKVLDNPIARRILERSGSSVDALKSTLGPWILDIFSGTPDETTFDRQVLIGRRHVDVNLPQSFMLLGIHVIRDGLEPVVATGGPRARSALNKALDIRTAVMLRAYQDDRDKMLRSRVLVENESMLALGRMSTTMAHEIKNPLAAILGALTVLRDRQDADSEDARVMGAVLDQVGRLSGTVKDLLDFARPVDIDRQPVGLGRLVDEVVSELRTDPSCRLVVDFTDESREAVLPVDPQRFKSVLYNLFANTHDATGGQGTITLSVTTGDGRLQLRIRDDGPGISEEIVHELFRPFTTDKVHGTGLGLAICTKIVESHGGSIVYEAGAGGACFRVTLPEAP